MRYPHFLPESGSIGFAAPSFGCAGPFEATFDYALKKFHSMGYQTVEGPNCRKEDGLGISSSPESCGRELADAYCSPDSDVLISCGGGEMMCRDLDYVDFDRIRQTEPKWFMGLSDNTNFTFLLTTLCDVASIYGPCAGSFGMEPWHPAIQDAFDLLSGNLHPLYSYGGYQKTMFVESDNPQNPYLITEPLQLHTIPEEPITISGRLIGGCMDVLVNLRGTEYDHVPEFLERYRSDGFIWFLEACDLNVWSISRALWQMEHSGWFRYVRGFLVGRPLCNGQVDNGLDQYQAVTEILGKYDVPIIMDTDLGHLPPSMPLICGSLAQIQASENHLTVEMSLQ